MAGANKPEGYHGPRSLSPQLNLPYFEGIGVLNADVQLVSTSVVNQLSEVRLFDTPHDFRVGAHQ